MRPWFPHLIHSVCPSSRHLASYWPDFTHAFLGHKLWQESWWLCCPESSNVPHTDTHTHTAVRKATFSDHHRCCRPWTLMFVFSQREEDKKKQGWKWRDGEIKCHNRKEGNEKRMKEMKTYEWVKGNLSREETGSDCWQKDKETEQESNHLTGLKVSVRFTHTKKGCKRELQLCVQRWNKNSLDLRGLKSEAAECKCFKRDSVVLHCD